MFERDCLSGLSGIITGGSSGIGLAMAKYLSTHGAKVTITGRNREKIVAACTELGPNALGVCGDVRRIEDVDANLKEHIDHHNKIDFLINNAAGNFLCRLEDMSPNAFAAVLDIVTKGTFHWSRAVFPFMKKAGNGRIVNIGTTYAWGHGAWVGHSGAAKAAVMNLTRTMAVEWGPMGILTNMIAPGAVADTEGVRRLLTDPEMSKRIHDIMPVPRMAEAWEIASLATFLIMPKISYINGAIIPVDGGSHLVIPGLLPAGFPVTKP